MTVALFDVSKSFGTFRALDVVSLTVVDGTIHALLGANGSGKSTLVRTVTGVYSPDEGTILVDGSPTSGEWTPTLASAAGIRVVHQEAPLADNLSIAESVALFAGYPRMRWGNIAWRSLWRSTQELLDRLAIQRDSRELTAHLTGAERAMIAVEIAVRSSGSMPRLLVLDEATAALPEAEAAPFLEQVRQIADGGCAVLMVTHRLAELDYADQITVLDGGRVAATGRPQDLGRNELISIMRGPTAAQRGSSRPKERGISVLWDEQRQFDTTSGVPTLEATGITGATVKGIDLVVRPGDIVGVVGVRGEGMDELPLLLAGTRALESGSISIGGRAMPPSYGPREALGAGVGYLPADRLHDGGITTLPLLDNIMLPDLGRYWHRRGAERIAAARAISYLDVRPDKPATVFGKLSGGNQQKAILGRLLRMRPILLVLADPTYGVDPAAREVMFDAIRDASSHGIAVVITSTEPEQLVGLCERVLVVRRGRVSEEVTGVELTSTRLLAKVL